MASPLLVTMGDPAGIGPEIVIKALLNRPDWRSDTVVVGDAAVLQRALALVQPDRASALGAMPLVELSSLADWPAVPPGALAFVQGCRPEGLPQWGRVEALAGRMAADCIEWAAREVLAGRARAMVTAPVHKEALSAAGVVHPGHTEMLQALAAEHVGVPVSAMPVRMMLSAPGLATVLVSIHVALRAAIEAVSSESVFETIRITHDHFRCTGLKRPRIAVAGLNPHAGEGGLFGREELDHIAPAIDRARALGLDVSGPHPPDTVFMRARQGHFDVVVAMYHDQGLIPVKLLGVEHGVNTTLGLPLVRTSPDHGTAFDIAGTGRAGADSLVEAIEAARVASCHPVGA
jgi:4-hydroxythreonine-4-phosphate dehydrogenase